MKKLVDDLSLQELSWAAAVALGLTEKMITWESGPLAGQEIRRVVIDEYGKPYDMLFGREFMPARDWETGGPIMDSTVLSVMNTQNRFVVMLKDETSVGHGMTMLEATTRAIVKKELGASVTIPKKLGVGVDEG